jgi:hypothetical protein
MAEILQEELRIIRGSNVNLYFVQRRTTYPPVIIKDIRWKIRILK